MTITRRESLLRITRAAAAATVLPHLLTPLQAAAAAWSMRLSTSTIQFSSLSLNEACARIAQLGFQGVDIWSAYEGCRHLDDALEHLGPSGLKDLLTQHKLELCSFSTYVGGYARYAELLGGVGGGLAIQGSAGPCAPKELTAKMRQFLESLKPSLELAEKYNSRLAIENHGSALLDGTDSFKAFVDLNRSPRLGLALAPYHLQAVNASVEEVIGICGSELFFFYAWQKGAATDQLPGHGPLDFKPALRALARIDYKGCVNPFMHGHPAPDAMSLAMAKSREYLLRIHSTL